MFPYITVFGKDIGSYQIAALLGIFAAGLYACRAAKRKGQDENDMIMVLLVAAGGVLLGGHLLYGITNTKLIVYTFQNLHQIDSFSAFINRVAIIFGGQVFYGGMLGGLAAGLIYCKIKKLTVRPYMDIAGAAIPLFHAFGRVGCFFGGCCYGLPSRIGFTYTRSLVESANGVQRFPVQLVEAGFNFCLFLLLATMNKQKRFEGLVLYYYFLFYGIGRFSLEFLRGDEYRGFLLGFSTSQIISLILITIALVKLIPYYIKMKRKQSA